MIRLFVIDDHPVVADGIRLRLPEYGFSVVGDAENVVDAIQKVEIGMVDIFLLDLFIKELNPEDNLRLLKKVFPKEKVVIFTQNDSMIWKCRMFRGGALGFFNKCDGYEKLASNLLNIHQGASLRPENVDKLIDFRNNRPPTELVAGAQEIGGFLKDGYTVKQIAKIMGQSQSSVEKKLTKLRLICKVKTNCQLIYYFFKDHLPK